DGFYFMQTLGRPLQAYLDCFSYKFGYTLERMGILRAISVALIGVAIALFADWLYSLRFSFWAALFIAGGVILIPQLYDDAVITASNSLPIAILFTLIAYRCINKGHIDSASQQINKSYIWYVVGGLFILLALLSYPATTFFFATLILSKVLFRDFSQWHKTRHEVKVEIVLFFIICGLYFIGAFLNMRYHAQAPIPDQYRLDHPNLSLSEIFNRVIMLGNIFNMLWEIFPHGNLVLQGKIILTVLFLGVLASLLSLFIKYKKNEINKQKIKDLLQAAIVSSLLLLVASGFFLVMPDRDVYSRDVYSRLLFGTVSAGLILLIWCAYRVFVLFNDQFRYLLTVLFFGGFFLLEAHYANIYMLDRAMFSENRMNRIREALADKIVGKERIRRIHFILRQPEYPYNRFFQVNGALVQLLGHQTYELRWCSLARGVPGEEKDHQKEMLTCLSKLPSDGIGVTYSYFDEPYTKTKGMIVIKNDKNQI
ncbi:MAG: hypothetical protein ACD_46C00582G0003, partial [uncultured bacterium]